MIRMLSPALAVLSVALLFAVPVSAGPSLLDNGGFEQGCFDPTAAPRHWSTEAFRLTSGFAWDDDVSHRGRASVRIASDTLNDARWIQVVQLDSHTDYVLSGYIKTEDVAHTSEVVDAGANLSIIGLEDAFIFSEPLLGDHDWTFVEVRFNSGDRTEATVACRLGMFAGETTGTMWCDDLRLREAR